MASAPINPTQLTPPRVAVIDERTGAISREWYRFFLSLLTSTQNTSDAADTQPDTNSLLATYDAMLASLTQEVQTNTSDLSASLQQQIDNVFMSSATQPRNEFGTISYLQQNNVPWLSFSQVPTNVPPTVGTVFWDGGTTLNLQMTANVVGRVNETEYVYVKASAAITKGQLCYHTGSVGSSGVITAAPTPLSLADPNQIVGVAAETIALNGFGLIQISGDLRGFNTTGSSVGETWADGDPLYYNPAYVGGLTKTKPSAPNQKSYIGEVINAGSGGSGSIHIRITVGSVLGGTDSNVQFSGIVNSDLIQYDSALQYWKNVAPSTITVGTATNLAGGAANRIAYQTGASTTGFITAPTVANTFLEWSGSAFQWSLNPLGTVTSVSGTGTVNGITLTGTVTTSGSLTLGGTLGGIANSQLTNSSITINGSAISLGGSVSVGTVTSVSGTGTVNGITLTGTVTSSGSLTLGGTLSGVSLTTQVSGTLPVGNGGTGATTFTSGYLLKGNTTSAVSSSIVYDNGSSVGINTSTVFTGYTGSTGNSVTFKNTSSVIWQNSSNTWSTTTAGGAITYWSDNNLYIDAKDSASNIIFRVNGDTERARITNNGYVLINETSASAASLQHNFEVNGDIMANGSGAGLFWANRSAAPSAGADWYGWYTTGGTIYLYNPAAGNIASINASTGAYTALSDAAKKKDFEPSAVGLDAVLALKPTLFRMDTDANDAPKQLGFIAQEVKDHIPQAYVEEQNTDAGGNESTYIGLNDRPIIAALVKAVQELEARVAQLEG